MTFVGDSVVRNGKMYGENRNVYSHRQVIISDWKEMAEGKGVTFFYDLFSVSVGKILL